MERCTTPVNRRISGSQVPAAKDFALAMSNVISEAKKHLLAAQQRQKSYADTKRRDVSYEVGSEVLLSTSNIKLKTPGARKLLPRWIGPFEIVKRIGVVAYRLKLPETMGIHNVFHVSLLKPYKANGRVKPPPPPVIENHNISYEVECVLQYEVRRSRSRPVKFYLIKWLGYGLEHNSWEPESNLSPEVLKEYWDSVVRANERLSRHGVGCESLPDILPKRKRRKRS